MSKIKSLAELKKIKETAKTNTAMRLTGENPDRTVVLVGMATCGIAAGARPVMSALLDEISKNNLEDVSVVATGCLGLCYAEPLVEVRVAGQDPIRYGNMTEELGRRVVTEHVMKGAMLDDLIIGREVNKYE